MGKMATNSSHFKENQYQTYFHEGILPKCGPFKWIIGEISLLFKAHGAPCESMEIIGLYSYEIAPKFISYLQNTTIKTHDLRV